MRRALIIESIDARPETVPLPSSARLPSAAETVSAFRAQQRLPSSAVSQFRHVLPAYERPSRDVCLPRVRAEEPAVRRFICQPTYRRNLRLMVDGAYGRCSRQSGIV